MATPLWRQPIPELQRDRQEFTLTAPAAGFAVWGSLNKGKWSGIEPPTAANIAAGRAKVKPNQVLFTIVQPGVVIARTTVGEASVLSVAEGQSAKVKPGAMPKASLAAKVSRVARISAGTDYEVLFEVTGADPRLMPGQSCKIALTKAGIAAAY